MIVLEKVGRGRRRCFSTMIKINGVASSVSAAVQCEDELNYFISTQWELTHIQTSLSFRERETMANKNHSMI